MVSKLKLILALCLLLCCITGCGTKNIGIGRRLPPQPWIQYSEFTANTTWNGGETATLTIDWGFTGRAPYTILVDMGGGVVEDSNNGAATNPFTQTFTLRAAGTYTWTATITDTNGSFGTATGAYTVLPPLNNVPVITNVAVSANVVTVSVTDADNEDVTVSASAFTGATVTAAVVVAGGNGKAVFIFTADDPFAGATGTSYITADDGNVGDNATDTATVTIPAMLIVIPDGAIGAVPLKPTAAVGETVTILVVTGDFPADAAFNYMNGVAVSCEDGGDFVDDTFNVGAIGGAQKDVDGVWDEMAPAPNTFFLPENFMMKASDVTADGSRDFMGFNITPVGAGEVTAGGYLFNFGMMFMAAGTYHLGILEFEEVKRTYYSDHAWAEHSWADISNDYPDIPNSVEVN